MPIRTSVAHSYKYCNVFGYSTRLITSLCHECSDYLLSFHSAITLYNYTVTYNSGNPAILSTDLNLNLRVYC
jgi:hypothetical protein